MAHPLHYFLKLDSGDRILAVLKQYVLLASVGLLLSCATAAPPNDILSPENALVYGYVEGSDYPIDSVELHEFGVVYVAPFKRPPRVLVYKNGYFMSENLKPGKYYIAAFSSNRKIYKLVNSVQSSYQNIINVAPGSLNFLGSLKIIVRKRHLLTHGEFEVQRMRKPDERTMLKFFYDITAGTGWQKKIIRRMVELRQ